MPSPPPLEPLDLDARIRAAELAVIVRDERMRRHVHDLGEGLRSRTTLAVIGGGAAVLVGALAARVFYRRRHPRDERPYRYDPRYEPRRGGFPWGQMVALALPLVPIFLRPRAEAGTGTGTVFSIGIPLLQRLLSRGRRERY